MVNNRDNGCYLGDFGGNDGGIMGNEEYIEEREYVGL